MQLSGETEYKHLQHHVRARAERDLYPKYNRKQKVSDEGDDRTSGERNILSL